jgi:hypothetical protein
VTEVSAFSTAATIASRNGMTMASTRAAVITVDHHPARDVAPLGILALHSRREGGQCGSQVRIAAHPMSFLQVRPHCASETTPISPGNRAKRTVTRKHQEDDRHHKRHALTVLITAGRH